MKECADCGSTDLRKPDKNQLKYAQKFLEQHVNKSEQLFIDVLKEMEDDLNIIDDAYLVMVKEYYLDNNNTIKMHRIKEIYRGDPVTFHLYTDDVGQRGVKGFTCLRHRNQVTQDKHECCEVCGSAMFPVHYVNRVKGEEQYFIEGEVLHFSKYSPSRLYGTSPIITLWNNVTTLMAMENYVCLLYTSPSPRDRQKSRMPSSA